MIRLIRFTYVVVIISLLSSCGINSELMFKRPDDFVYDQIELDSMTINYRIQPNDIISFEIYTNEAALMLEVTTGPLNNISSVQKASIEYFVDSDGMVELPLIGRQVIGGLTVMEAQSKIEKLFESQFNNPFVQLKVLNRRVMVFPSPAGTGEVLELGSQNISLLEAVAKAGGIGEGAKAYDILLIRNAIGERKVFHVDLSTIEGLEYAKLSLESGDIIYVQPNNLSVSLKLQSQVRPYTSLLTSVLSIVSIIVVFSR
ncbi:MAG: polysaccharide biosynthesis/export family protein [Flavobacteriales bacterium]